MIPFSCNKKWKKKVHFVCYLSYGTYELGKVGSVMNRVHKSIKIGRGSLSNNGMT
jgi:hypothetical protein